MWHGVHVEPVLEEANPLQGTTVQQIAIIADPGGGPPLSPWIMESQIQLNQRHPDGRFKEIASLIPQGAVLVGFDPLETERRPLYEILMSLEAKVFCFDGIPVDITFLDELSEFVEAKRQAGEWIQVIIEAAVPKDQASFEDLLDISSMMNVDTGDGVMEEGRQMCLVLGQYDGAAVDFSVAYARTLPGELIESIPLSKKVETAVDEDWLGCFAEAGIVGFLTHTHTQVYAGVNLVQGGSPYRQLRATRVLQWYLSEWNDALRQVPGESIELGLYEVQRVTEELIQSYKKAGHISEATYGISFSAMDGEITSDIVLFPIYGIEGISGSGVARIQKG
ncbi:hypothetical protein C0431_13250 [bacterium]|nr:hypothetical protein [bacterium]